MAVDDGGQSLAFKNFFFFFFIIVPQTPLRGRPISLTVFGWTRFPWALNLVTNHGIWRFDMTHSLMIIVTKNRCEIYLLKPMEFHTSGSSVQRKQYISSNSR